MKEVDIIAIFIQSDYITQEECYSALELFPKQVEEKKNYIVHPLHLKYMSTYYNE